MALVSRHIAEQLSSASWIRRMFEEADKLRAQVGAENVFDFSLGNPHLEPPKELVDRLRQLTERPPAGMHRYMPNAGYPEARARIADWVGQRESTNVPASHVIMTAGAACGLNVVFRALLDPGDEVVLVAPIFPEYRFYVMHAGGECRIAQTSANFDLDLSALADAIGPRTRAVVINSPNNPTGRVYPAQTIDGLAQLLTEASRNREQPIVLISDEPYRRLVYDGTAVPSLFDRYDQTVIVASFSKDLGLAGERIGYLVVHPRLTEAPAVLNGLIFCLRTLGFVNAPALMQRAVAELLDASVDIEAYRHNRDLLCEGLQAIGYEVRKPEGAFYLFPRSPIPDDTEFVRRLQEEHVLAVPGRGFGRAGHFRLSYALPPELILRALPGFERAFCAGA